MNKQPPAFCDHLQAAIDTCPPAAKVALEAVMRIHCRKVIVTDGTVHPNTGGVPTTPPKKPV